MIQSKQSTEPVTNSDLLPQIKKTRNRLGIFISIFLAIFLFLHVFILNSIVFWIFSVDITHDQLPSPALGSDQTNYFFLVVILATFVVWLVMSYISWILLYQILKPVSDSIRQREQFINNARHELRTPLTILKSEIELVQDNELSESVKLDILGIKLQVDRLIDLSQQLLSNLEQNTFKELNSDLEISSTINKVNKEISRIYNHKRIELKCQIDDRIRIQTQVSLFNQLIVNVIENAYKHSANKSSLEVFLDPDLTELVFKNELNPDDQINHSGIGIQAAKAIAAKLNIEISHTQKNNQFVVTLGKLSLIQNRLI